MIADIVYALFLTGVGGLLAFVLGIRGWVLPGFGFLLGVSVVSLIGAIQALVWMSIAPVYTLIAAIVILLVVCVTLRIHKAIDHQVLSKNLVLVAITFVCIVAAAWIAQ